MTRTDSLTRRGFMRAAGGTALVGSALPLLLSACGGTAAPSSPAGAPASGTGGSAAGTSSGAAKGASLFPTFAPVQGAPKADFPSTGQEYEDGFTYYPKNPVKLWTKDPPGSGGVVHAFTIRLSGLPATPLDQNQAWQAVNKQLNADVRFTNPLSADYQAKLAAVMAGKDLPDIILFNGGLGGTSTIAQGVSNLPLFLEQSMADLTPYLRATRPRTTPTWRRSPRSPGRTRAACTTASCGCGRSSGTCPAAPGCATWPSGTKRLGLGTCPRTPTTSNASWCSSPTSRAGATPSAGRPASSAAAASTCLACCASSRQCSARPTTGRSMAAVTSSKTTRRRSSRKRSAISMTWCPRACSSRTP